jgi:hypothetical protein
MPEAKVVLHLIRSEDLNHHGALFAGQMAKWLVEAGLMVVQDLLCEIHRASKKVEKSLNPQKKIVSAQGDVLMKKVDLISGRS